MPSLSSSLRVGRCDLKHRTVMAPLTRYRADNDHVQLPIATEYYSQRASVPGTLIVTEATFISPRASGFGNVPGIYNDVQIKQWREITAAVHAKGSYVYCQLWALGRAATPQVLKDQGGFDLVSSSPSPMNSNSATPRALSETEIHEFIADYAQAARNAIAAGFDGVEIHGANGYLIDQFIQDACNQRTDGWGGSIEKRSRFALEVTQAVVDAVGADRTGIRLSPFSTFQGTGMVDPIPQFRHVMHGLKAIGGTQQLAYVHLVESRISGNADVETTDKINFAMDIWPRDSPLLLAGGFQPDSARRAVEDEYPDRQIAIVFGRYFISNPDLPYRLSHDVPLTQYDRSTFYSKCSEKGYIDYPFSDEFQRSVAAKT